MVLRQSWDFEDVEQHLETIGALFVGLDLEASRAAALAALEDIAGGHPATFQQAGPAVVEAIHQNLGWQLRCPGTALQSYYGLSCPP